MIKIVVVLLIIAATLNGIFFFLRLIGKTFFSSYNGKKYKYDLYTPAAVESCLLFLIVLLHGYL